MKKKFRVGEAEDAEYFAILCDARVAARDLARRIGDGRYVNIYTLTFVPKRQYVPIACER